MQTVHVEGAVFMYLGNSLLHKRHNLFDAMRQEIFHGRDQKYKESSEGKYNDKS